jgi:phosphate starvation-inducible PhoH-like protein
MLGLLGREDATLRCIEALVPEADIHVRGDRIAVRGAQGPAQIAVDLIEEVLAVIGRGGSVGPDDVRRIFTMLTEPPAPDPRNNQSDDAVPRPAEVLTQSILSSRGRTVRPKTLGQKRYVDAIESHVITFGIGPAGTGKTYLAMAKAVQALQAKRVSRIILTRPAVEAGERLGFLPGTLNEKIDPYLRPLYDALQDMMDAESIPRLMEAGTIEVAPLAYMRGRTLNDAFIVLDEAQNTSSEQMKMFLTRLGFGAKMVVTGDITQTDLPGGTASGLLQVRDILTGLEDLTFCELTSKDVVRHRLVSQIIDAYARDEETRVATAPRAGSGRVRHER